MTKKEINNMYNNKYFYEIVEYSRLRVTVVGPLENVRYVARKEKNSSGDIIEFVQVSNGIIIKAFTRNEILVTDKVL